MQHADMCSEKSEFKYRLIAGIVSLWELSCMLFYNSCFIKTVS